MSFAAAVKTEPLRKEDLNSPEVLKMSSNIADVIANKFGIDHAKAEGIVKNLIPTVMSSLAKKTSDPNDNSFTIQGILGSLSGGLGGIMDKVKKMF